MSDGSLATLADVRADIMFAQQYSIYTWGSVDEGGVTDKINQFNVAGLHYATSGVFFHQGVKNAWADHFVVSDPYVRGLGWTGVASAQTQGGLPMGCNDQSKDQVRFAGFGGYYTDSITGGVTFEYGLHNFVQRFTGRVGNSAADPFVVRIKDWGVSGPALATRRVCASRKLSKPTSSRATRTTGREMSAHAVRAFREVAGHLRQRSR